MPGSDNVKLKAGTLGVVGAATMGAVMMSPALGVYANFGPMVLTAGKAVPFVFFISLLATLPTAICYGLISKEIPSSGSAYTWLWETVNPFVGVWIGCILAVFFIVVVFLQPLLCGLFFNDLLRFLGINATFYSFIAGVVLSSIVVASITYKGIEFSEKGSLIDLIIQMLVVAALAITIIVLLTIKDKLDFTPFLPTSSLNGLSGISSALIFGILAFCGFGVISNLAEETKNPRESITKAMVLACVGLGLYWILISWIYTISIPIEQIINCVKSDTVPLISIAHQYWGVGEILIIITGFIASIGVYIATVVGASRVLYAMGRDGSISPVFGILDKKTQVPNNALHLIFVLTLIFVLVPAGILGIYNTFIWWGKAVVFFALVTYIFVSIANPIFYLRFRRESFSIFWNGIIAVISLLINVILLYQAFFVECWNAGWAMGKSVIVFVTVWLFLALFYILYLKKNTPELFNKKAQFYVEK